MKKLKLFIDFVSAPKVNFGKIAVLFMPKFPQSICRQKIAYPIRP
jgi:hypothetical protein